MLFKSTDVQIRLFPHIRVSCNLNTPGSREEDMQGHESSRGGSSLNIPELQKIDVSLVVMESVLK